MADHDYFVVFQKPGDPMTKPPSVGRQRVHQGIAASEDDCCIVHGRSEYCDLKSEGAVEIATGRLVAGVRYMCDSMPVEHFNGTSTKSLRKFDHCY